MLDVLHWLPLPAVDHIPDCCPGLEVSARPCTSLPARSLLSHPRQQRSQLPSINGTGVVRYSSSILLVLPQDRTVHSVWNAAPPAADHIPYWCHGLEVYPGSCSGLPPRSLPSHPGHQRMQFTPIIRTGATLCSFCSYIHNPGPCILGGWSLCVEWASVVAKIAPQDSF